MSRIVTITCEISGPRNDRDALVALMIHENDIDGQVFDFGRILPIPGALADRIHGFGTVLGLVELAQEGVDHAAEALTATLPRRFAESLPDRLESLKVSLGKQIGVTTEEDLVARLKALGPPTEARQALTTFIETGYIDQYDWSHDHWGTRWNAFCLELWREVDSLRFRFVTERFPAPVFRALAARFPNLHFVCHWQVENGSSGEEQFNFHETAHV
jgi:hypothetical protein